MTTVSERYRSAADRFGARVREVPSGAWGNPATCEGWAARDEVHDMLEGMLPMDAVLRQSGHYGPKVEVAADADEQTRLIAFTGRRP